MSLKLPEGDGLRQLLLGILGVLLVGGAITLGVSLTDSNSNGKPDTVTVHVNVGAGDGHPTDTVTVPEAVVDKTRDSLTHANLEEAPRDATPPTDAQIERTANVETQVKPLPEAGAVQGFAGCVTRILPVNYSSRNGARATEFVLHYTVSANRPGWSDVNAIVALFSSPARQASSNFVLDSEGNCAYIVPIEAKAWTQAGGNPWSVSVEVIDTGGEPRYLEPAGMAKLKSIIEQVHARTGIPLSRGAVSSSCTPVRAGIVQHKDFGLCGGGHVDITPFSVDGVLASLQLGKRQVLVARELKAVKGARKPKGTGHSQRYWCKRVVVARARVATGQKHRRPARRRVLKRVWRGQCAGRS